ncbi:MAG: RluA family pseudouridine synthase [Gammaproteobacteria bacterium]|nr:RluA family pseudouridine synthase [Gammaproteobacteria bacterium]
MKLEIIYQDEYLLAVNKPSGMLSVPGRGAAKQDCVVARVQQIFSEIRVVHRLDCHTSGVMLLAKGRMMQRQLSRLFHDREVQKYYIALVAGTIGQTSGVVDIPLRGDPDNRPMQIIDHVHGKPAQTQWCVLRYQSAGPFAQSSRLQLRPVTGRTHQLRVHCRALGHPIVGDQLYNGAANDDAERMMLHAERLEFTHPATNKKMCLLAACEF